MIFTYSLQKGLFNEGNLSYISAFSSQKLRINFIAKMITIQISLKSCSKYAWILNPQKLERESFF